MKHRKNSSRLVLFTLVATLLGFPAMAASKKTTASGTLTVNGKPTVLKYGWASQGSSDDGRELLVLLFADREVAEADQAPERLAELAASGKLSALRILWSTGYDWLAAVPYQADLEGSGKRASETPTLNLDAYDGDNVEADVRSKRLGQHVHFSAKIEGPIRKVAVIEVESPAMVEEVEGSEAEEEESSATTGDDPHSLKLRLGKLGYSFEPDLFYSALSDGNLEAVQIFLALGQSPNYAEDDNHVMIIAAQRCESEPTGTRTPILEALIAAGGKVDAKDQNGSTPLLWAAQFCDAAGVNALIKAGANVNAKAKGGATPLMMAKVFNRAEIVALLKKAGAKED